MSNATASITQLDSPPELRVNGLAVTGFFFLGFIGGIAAFVAICFCYVYYQRKVVYKGRRPSSNTVHPRSRNNFDTVVVVDPVPIQELDLESGPELILALNSLPQPLPVAPTDAYFDKGLPVRPSSLIPEMFDPYNFNITSEPSSPTSPRTHSRWSVGSIVRASVASSTTLGLPLHVPTHAPDPF